jgi:hypothetical protein
LLGISITARRVASPDLAPPTVRLSQSNIVLTHYPLKKLALPGQGPGLEPQKSREWLFLGADAQIFDMEGEAAIEVVAESTLGNAGASSELTECNALWILGQRPEYRWIDPLRLRVPANHVLILAHRAYKSFVILEWREKGFPGARTGDHRLPASPAQRTLTIGAR